MYTEFQWQQLLQKRNFLPLFDHWGKKKIPNPFCASTRQANTRHSDPRLWIAYDLCCRQSSSDKKFFGRTERQTDWSNNNTPDLSLDSVGTTILMRCIKIGYFTVVWDSQISINKTVKLIKYATVKSGLTAANENWEPSYYQNREPNINSKQKSVSLVIQTFILFID